MVKEEALFEVATMFRSLLKGISHEWNKKGGSKVSFPQFKMLHYLKKQGPLKVSEVADALGITSAAVTGITDKLLAEGYVTRERAENDRRVVIITVTEQGEAVIEQILESQKETIQMIFSKLEEADILHLRRVFSTILKNIENND